MIGFSFIAWLPIGNCSDQLFSMHDPIILGVYFCIPPSNSLENSDLENDQTKTVVSCDKRQWKFYHIIIQHATKETINKKYG